MYSRLKVKKKKKRLRKKRHRSEALPSLPTTAAASEDIASARENPSNGHCEVIEGPKSNDATDGERGMSNYNEAKVHGTHNVVPLWSLQFPPLSPHSVVRLSCDV